jgi:hypothetical protein
VIKNISEEEAGFEDTSADKDTGEGEDDDGSKNVNVVKMNDVTVNINTEGKYDNITYSKRQSSTKTEAVARYVEFPILNHFMQLVTSSSNPGPHSGDELMMKSEEDMHEKPEKRDEVDNTNPEGKHDDEKVEKQLYEKPGKRNMMVDINTEGEYDEEKTVRKQLYEKPEKKDLVADINSEGKYDYNNLVENDREHFIKGDRFEDTEGMRTLKELGMRVAMMRMRRGKRC